MAQLITHQVARAISREFPSVKRNGNLKVDDIDDVVTVTGFGANECEAFCRDVDSIVYSQFEGKIRALEWAVAEEYGYVQFSIIPETAHIA
jgi:hypothetical protein